MSEHFETENLDIQARSTRKPHHPHRKYHLLDGQFCLCSFSRWGKWHSTLYLAALPSLSPIDPSRSSQSPLTTVKINQWDSSRIWFSGRVTGAALAWALYEKSGKLPDLIWCFSMLMEKLQKSTGKSKINHKTAGKQWRQSRCIVSRVWHRRFPFLLVQRCKHPYVANVANIGTYYLVN